MPALRRALAACGLVRWPRSAPLGRPAVFRGGACVPRFRSCAWVAAALRGPPAFSSSGAELAPLLCLCPPAGRPSFHGPPSGSFVSRGAWRPAAGVSLGICGGPCGAPACRRPLPCVVLVVLAAGGGVQRCLLSLSVLVARWWRRVCVWGACRGAFLRYCPGPSGALSRLCRLALVRRVCARAALGGAACLPCAAPLPLAAGCLGRALPLGVCVVALGWPRVAGVGGLALGPGGALPRYCPGFRFGWPAGPVRYACVSPPLGVLLGWRFSPSPVRRARVGRLDVPSV